MAVTSSKQVTVTLPTDEQILITREFDAPKHLLFKAYTTPELVRRWFHANRGEMTLCEIDFHGEYREVAPDERLVSTEVYEGAPDAPALDTVTFTEVDGRTTLAIL